MSEEVKPSGLSLELAVSIYPTPTSPLDFNASNFMTGDEDDMEMDDPAGAKLEDLDELLNGKEQTQKIEKMNGIKSEFDDSSVAYNPPAPISAPPFSTTLIPTRPAFLTSSTIPLVQSYKPTASTSALPLPSTLPTPIPANSDSSFGRQMEIPRPTSPTTESIPPILPSIESIPTVNSPPELIRTKSKTPPTIFSSPSKGHFSVERELFPETRWPSVEPRIKSESREQSVKMESEESNSGNSTPNGESKIKRGKKVKKEDDVVQLIGDLPLANEKVSIF